MKLPPAGTSKSPVPRSHLYLEVTCTPNNSFTLFIDTNEHNFPMTLGSSDTALVIIIIMTNED